MPGLLKPACLPASSTVRALARAKLPTRFGEFQIVSFSLDGTQLDDVALIRGRPDTRRRVPTRMHSECVTGDVFGSARCDCGDQLDASLRMLADSEDGILLYLRQEGRGIGIANKVRAYALQDGGLDTVDANLHLGFDDDLRRYDVAAGMLHALGVGAVELFTNNPRKVDGLEAAGIDVTRRPLQTAPTEHSRGYLETKRARSGHLLEL